MWPSSYRKTGCGVWRVEFLLLARRRTMKSRAGDEARSSFHGLSRSRLLAVNTQPFREERVLHVSFQCAAQSVFSAALKPTGGQNLCHSPNFERPSERWRTAAQNNSKAHAEHLKSRVKNWRSNSVKLFFFCLEEGHQSLLIFMEPTLLPGTLTRCWWRVCSALLSCSETKRWEERRAGSHLC